MSNSWLCVDASLVVRLVADPADESTQQLWQGWDTAGRQLAAPTLLYYEVTNALYRYYKLGVMSMPSVRLALKAARALPVRVDSPSGLHRRALDLAERFSLPATYDAHYLALAEWLEAEFWTADGRLARAVQPSLSWVHLAV